MPLPSLPFRPLCPHTGLFAHPLVNCLCPIIPFFVATCIRLWYLPAPSLPRHAWQIHNVVPLTPPKSLLPSHSSAFEPLFSATMSHGDSPLPCSLSPCLKSQVLASTPPTLPLSTSACQCTYPVSVLLLTWLHSPLTRFSRSRPSSACSSYPSTVWGNSCAPPPYYWTLTRKKELSDPKSNTAYNNSRLDISDTCGSAPLSL